MGGADDEERARAFLEAGQISLPAPDGLIGGSRVLVDLAEALQSGVVLCNRLNEIEVGVVPDDKICRTKLDEEDDLHGPKLHGPGRSPGQA